MCRRLCFRIFQIKSTINKGVDPLPPPSCRFTLLQRSYSDIRSKYQSLLGAEKLDFDPHQLSVVEQLHGLQKKLADYEPPTSSSSGGGIMKVREW